jgi:hypothetical protein
MVKQGGAIKNHQLKLKHSNMYFKYINFDLVLLVSFKSVNSVTEKGGVDMQAVSEQTVESDDASS